MNTYKKKKHIKLSWLLMTLVILMFGLLMVNGYIINSKTGITDENTSLFVPEVTVE